MNSNHSLSTGVKRSDIYKPDGVNSPLMVLSTKCVRGARGSDISFWQEEVLKTMGDQGLIDSVILAFQVRDVRGGRGERQLFYTMISNLYLKHPSLVMELMKLLPEYGGWMDVLHMKRYIHNEADQFQINEMIRKQILDDERRVDNPSVLGSTKFSLLGKWLPREGNKYDTMAKELALHFWEHDERYCRKSINIMGSYRKRLSALNNALQTVETFECSNRWDEIDPACVPARALNIKMSAYLNENSLNEIRHPNDQKRNTCRNNFQNFFKKAADGETAISGADTMYPHELVRNIMRSRPEEIDQRNAWNAIWDSMVDNLTFGVLGSSIAMCDFSGSMRSNMGTPYHVSIAMGILTASINTGPFRNKIMSFDSTPMWHTIPEQATLSKSIMAING